MIIMGLTTLPANARAETYYNVDRKGIAINGYDTVAYFTVSEAVKGKKDIRTTWQGATWFFASARNRDAFLKYPDKYAPRYGGYCAYGVAEGGLFNINPDAWTVYEGSLYLNQNKRVRDLWLQDVPGHIKRADVLWPKIRKKK